MSLNHPDTPLRVLAMTIVGNFGVVLLGASCEQVASKLRASRERIEAGGRRSQKARCIALHWAMWCKRGRAALAMAEGS
ncbi:hypothetical protein CKO42_05680 [Lamprobacter modestohalophilus]|uniref:Uncharacterized protein n=1 Tax=Lamprobacter modestohalophilus TaxID=1064514 RepID=A0A9X0W6Z9_9GAMM|nr:hypothetical protein [Lamprobacter modestohalophilus]